MSTANQDPPKEWFSSATQRAKRSAPSERVLKTEVRKSNDRLFVAFSLTYFIRLLENPMTASPVLGIQ